jgi:hypothetical protein
MKLPARGPPFPAHRFPALSFMHIGLLLAVHCYQATQCRERKVRVQVQDCPVSIEPLNGSGRESSVRPPRTGRAGCVNKGRGSWQANNGKFPIPGAYAPPWPWICSGDVVHNSRGRHRGESGEGIFAFWSLDSIQASRRQIRALVLYEIPISDLIYSVSPCHLRCQEIGTPCFFMRRTEI